MRACVPALAAVLAFPLAAGAAPLPDWLSVSTGAGGYAVSLTADVTTITNAAVPGSSTTSTAPFSIDLDNVLGLSFSMSFASPCEFDPGCVMVAPLDVTVAGLPGSLFVIGPSLYLNGAPLTYDLNPAGTPNGHVSGTLHFTSLAGYTDNDESILLVGDPASVPEPTTLAVLGIGLLGLGCVRRPGGYRSATPGRLP